MPSVPLKTNVKKPEHVHKFKAHAYGSGHKIFFCTLPDCNKKLKVALALGKKCICWRCGEPFILNEYSLRLVRPHCEDCHKSKNKEFDSSIKNPKATTPTLHPLEINDTRINPISDEVKESLRTGSWEIKEENLSLTDRLKQATTGINHAKHEDESDEEL